MKMTGLQLADQMGHYQQEEGEEDEAVEEVLGPIPDSSLRNVPPRSSAPCTCSSGGLPPKSSACEPCGLPDWVR